MAKQNSMNDEKPTEAHSPNESVDQSDASHSHAAPQAHEESEPWLVSYADMMTLLFGFFVVMYAFASSNPRNEDCVRLKLMDAFRSDTAQSGDSKDSSAQNAAMRALELLVTMLNLESIEEVIQKILEAEERAKDGEGEAADSRDKKEKIASDDLKALMGAEEIKDLVVISVPVDVLFDQGTTKLKPSSAAKLNEVSASIRKVNNIDSIRIVGHTDSTSNDNSNGLDSWALSVVRASEVAKFLSSKAVPKGLIRVEGRGSSEPILPEKTLNGAWIAENMKKNRRIEIMISKDRKYVR